MATRLEILQKFVKAIVTTINIQRIKIKIKNRKNNHRMWERGVKIVDLLKCVWIYMTVSVKHVNIAIG